MKRKITIGAALLLLSFLWIGCTDMGDPWSNINPPVPVFPANVQAIFNGNCTSCHSGGSPSAGLNLSSFTATMARVPAVIVPGNPDNSVLVQRLEGNPSLMPPGGPALSTTDIATIRSWIAAGAIPDTTYSPGGGGGGGEEEEEEEEGDRG